MDTRFQVPASWSAVRAAAGVAAAEGDVGAVSDLEHPTERDAMMAKAGQMTNSLHDDHSNGPKAT